MQNTIEKLTKIEPFSERTERSFAGKQFRYFPMTIKFKRPYIDILLKCFSMFFQYCFKYLFSHKLSLQLFCETVDAVSTTNAYCLIRTLIFSFNFGCEVTDAVGRDEPDRLLPRLPPVRQL